MELANAIVQGILLGGLFALFAAGLSLIFGVMRLVNIAHGDFIVLSAFVALSVTTGYAGLVSVGQHAFVVYCTSYHRYQCLAASIKARNCIKSNSG